MGILSNQKKKTRVVRNACKARRYSRSKSEPAKETQKGRREKGGGEIESFKNVAVIVGPAKVKGFLETRHVNSPNDSICRVNVGGTTWTNRNSFFFLTAKGPKKGSKFEFSDQWISMRKTGK